MKKKKVSAPRRRRGPAKASAAAKPRTPKAKRASKPKIAVTARKPAVARAAKRAPITAKPNARKASKQTRSKVRAVPSPAKTKAPAKAEGKLLRKAGIRKPEPIPTPAPLRTSRRKPKIAQHRIEPARTPVRQRKIGVRATPTPKAAVEKQSSLTKVVPAGPEEAKTTSAAVPEPRPRTNEAAESSGWKVFEPSPGQEQPAPKSKPPEPFPFKIPPILLEGDEPALPAKRRYSKLYPEPLESGEVASFDTGVLALTARDPHCLYAHWDLAPEQQKVYNAKSADGHLVLRTYLGESKSKIISEMRVHPESQHWFVHVPNANRIYISELGYFGKSPETAWTVVAVSNPALTPSDAPSTDVRFIEKSVSVRLPEPHPIASPIGRSPGLEKDKQELSPIPSPALELSGVQLPRPVFAPVAAAQSVVTPTDQIVAAADISHSQAETRASVPNVPHLPTEASPIHPGFEAAVAAPGLAADKAAPSDEPVEARPFQEVTWTEQQERRITRAVYGETLPEVENIASQSVLKAPRAHEREEITSLEAVRQARALAAAPHDQSVSSAQNPTAILQERQEQPSDFWFTVNAELVVYGATEPDAEVTVSGRRIRLRPDGTFSFRFALPDGTHDMKLRAVSALQDERWAELQVRRATTRGGEVGVHPQDPALKPPPHI